MSTAALKDLGVAIQSVIYYIAACSTVRKCAYRRKRRKEAIRAERDKAQLELEQPGLYNHPLPFATNPHWEEEIRLGPGPPRRDRRRADKSESKWAQMLSDDGILAKASSGKHQGEILRSVDTATTVESLLSEETWNHKRYQREDEALWGDDMDHSSQEESSSGQQAKLGRGSTVGLVGASRPNSKRNSEKYHYTVRCPPVNELHPPVVSIPPTNGAQMRWMLQPPPPAKVMEGKERANRSRASSGISSQSRAGPAMTSSHGKRAVTATSEHGNDENSKYDVNQDVDSTDFGSTGIRLQTNEPVKQKKHPPPIAISEDESLSPTSSLTLTSKRPPSVTMTSSPVMTLPYRLTTTQTALSVVPSRETAPLRDINPTNSGLLNSSILNKRSASPMHSRSNHERETVVARATAPKEENVHVAVPVLESVFPYSFRFPDTAISGRDPRQRWSMEF